MTSSVNVIFNEKPLFTMIDVYASGRSQVAFDKLAMVVTEVYKKTAKVFGTILDHPENFLDPSLAARLLPNVSPPDREAPFVACVENSEIPNSSLSKEDKNTFRTIVKGRYVFNRVESVECSVHAPFVSTDEGDTMLMERIKDLVEGRFPSVPNVVISTYNVPVS